MTAAEVYLAMRTFLEERDWERFDDHIWVHNDFAGEYQLGDAVHEQLIDEGINERQRLVPEPSAAGRPSLFDQAVDRARAEFRPDMAAARDAMFTAPVGLHAVTRLDEAQARRDDTLADRRLK